MNITAVLEGLIPLFIELGNAQSDDERNQLLATAGGEFSRLIGEIRKKNELRNETESLAHLAARFAEGTSETCETDADAEALAYRSVKMASYLLSAAEKEAIKRSTSDR